MKIYISGTFSAQKRLREVASELHHMGHQVTSTWLNEVKKPEAMIAFEWNKCLALKDLVEVGSSDIIILDLDEPSTTGGRYVEWGFAVGRYNILKWIVGQDHYGVFNTLADRSFSHWQEVINALH